MGTDEAQTVRDLKAHQAVLLSMVSEFSALSSRDPEVPYRLAEMLIAQGRFEEAAPQLNAAHFGFDELLGRHLLAFADHAAEFYAGSGNDCRQALELARVNVANRPTRRAVKQEHAIAVNADERLDLGDIGSAMRREISIPAALDKFFPLSEARRS
jgi:hypothetical protein